MTRKPAFLPILGTMPVLQFVPPVLLQIDPTYQRSIENPQSQKLITKIAREWNWGLCKVLVVSRRADQGLFVVDGQHRQQGALRRQDIPQLPCIISTFSSAQEEAALFAQLNRQRTPLKAIDIFRAAVAGKDPDACRTMSLLSQAGLTLATSTNNVSQAPGAVSNISGIREAQRIHGDKATVKALRILRLGFDDQVLRYAGTIFGGIAGTVADATKSGHGLSEALLIAVLAGASQEEWYRDIMAHKGKFPEMRVPTCATHIISTAYEEAAAEATEEAA